MDTAPAQRTPTRGRPPFPEQQRRSAKVEARVTQTERAAFDRLAASRGMEPADLVRELVFGAVAEQGAATLVQRR